MARGSCDSSLRFGNSTTDIASPSDDISVRQSFHCKFRTDTQSLLGFYSWAGQARIVGFERKLVFEWIQVDKVCQQQKL